METMAMMMAVRCGSNETALLSRSRYCAARMLGSAERMMSEKAKLSFMRNHRFTVSWPSFLISKIRGGTLGERELAAVLVKRAFRRARRQEAAKQRAGLPTRCRLGGSERAKQHLER